MGIVELYYREGGRQFTIANPSREEVTQAIAGLNGHSRTVVLLQLTNGIVSIGGGNQDKVKINMNNYKDAERHERRSGWLSDPRSANDDREIPMLVADVYDEVSLELAIDKNVAVEVALYYMGENPFPENVSWIWGRSSMQE